MSRVATVTARASRPSDSYRARSAATRRADCIEPATSPACYPTARSRSSVERTIRSRSAATGSTGKISSVLSRHRSVRASVAVAREDTPGDKRLVAYLVADADAGLTHTGLREFLRASLPDYMLPAAFVRIDAFPLTAHGKIDRAALPVPDADNTLQDEVADAPCTDTERQVADVLGELLKLEAIGLDDNFFLLGGHSLLGAQLIARLREVFGVRDPVANALRGPDGSGALGRSRPPCRTASCRGAGRAPIPAAFPRR